MKLKKQVVSAGVHYVSTLDGGRRKEVITPARIESWANTISELAKAGHKLPAPFCHDLGAVPVREGLNGALENSYQNGGYWEQPSVEINEQNVPVLSMVIDTPEGDKVGTTVQDTSIYVQPEWVDGTGRTWYDVPMHVALVTHPIEPGQKNFEPVEGLAIAMSNLYKPMTMSYEAIDMNITDEKSIPSLGSVVSDLKSVAGIDLGDDTTPDNLLDRLAIALRQKRASEQGNGDDKSSTSKPPKGASRESVAIQMSEINTATNVKESDEYKALERSHQALLMSATVSRKTSLEDRITKLLNAKRITQQHAEELKKALEAFQMSFNEDGTCTKSILEYQLDAIEQVQGEVASQVTNPMLMSSVPTGHEVEANSSGAITDEDRQAAIKQMLKSTR